MNVNPPAAAVATSPGARTPGQSNQSSQRIAVVGSGISGLSAAWLLSQRHRVTVFEAEPRPGGHSHTVLADDGRGEPLPVDTGFIVFNTDTYPNLCALFDHLSVPSRPTEMGFAVSLDQGALEYSGELGGLFAQRGNLVSRRFWAMLRDLVRFYREAPRDVATLGELALDDYLAQRGYSAAFRDDHLYPMAAAIWSTPAAEIGRYPVAAFVRFCENHHLLTLGRRPPWRTVAGGSREYVKRLTAAIAERPGCAVALGRPARRVLRDGLGVTVLTGLDSEPGERFDHVVLATHADQALRLLAEPSGDERRLLGAFAYSRNRTLLHRDAALMPQRRAVWSAWNYLADRRTPDRLCVTYWMNRLQHLPEERSLFVTLNPVQEPDPATVLLEQSYEHPLFDRAALRAQRELWSLQGRQRSWFCGAYFGSGFHEDGLQAGLAVAEALGGVRRPWSVANESGRIVLPGAAEAPSSPALAPAGAAAPLRRPQEIPA